MYTTGGLVKLSVTFVACVRVGVCVICAFPFFMLLLKFFDE